MRYLGGHQPDPGDPPRRPPPSTPPGAVETFEATLDAATVAHITVGPEDHVVLMTDPALAAHVKQMRTELADRLGIDIDRLTIIGGGRSMFTINVEDPDELGVCPTCGSNNVTRPHRKRCNDCGDEWIGLYREPLPQPGGHNQGHPQTRGATNKGGHNQGAATKGAPNQRRGQQPGTPHAGPQ